MIDTLRSELVKLRTVRMNSVLAAIAVAFPVIVMVLTALLADVDDLDARDVASITTGTSVITGMLLGVIGAAAITSEFGFGTIRVTFAATPKRMRVVIAKGIVTVAVGMVVEAAVVALSFVLGAVLLNGRGGDVSIGDLGGDARAALAGVVIFAAIVSLLGLGLGLLIRSTPASIAVLILWPLVAEGIIAALLGVAGVEQPFKWLPYNAGINLGNPDAGLDDESLGRVLGGLYFFAVTAVIVTVGAWSTNRRDA